MPCSTCRINGHNTGTCNIPPIIEATNIFNKYIDDSEDYDITTIPHFTKDIVKYLHSIYTDGFVGNDPQYPRNMILTISHNGSLQSFVQIDINLVRDEDQSEQLIFKKPDGVEYAITYTKNIEQGRHKYNQWMTHYFIPNCYGVGVLTDSEVTKFISRHIADHFRRRRWRMVAVPAVLPVSPVGSPPGSPTTVAAVLPVSPVGSPPAATTHQPRPVAQLRPRPRRLPLSIQPAPAQPQQPPPAPAAQPRPAPSLQRRISIARRQMTAALQIAQESDLTALRADAIAQYAERQNGRGAVTLREEAITLRTIAEIHREDANLLRNALNVLRENAPPHVQPTVNRPPPVELCSLQDKVIDVDGCPICMNDFGNTDKSILRCGHQICITCLLTNIEVLSKNQKKYHCECPICRGAYYNLK